MGFAEYLKVSFLMMRSKPVRSVLSLLGIYIGVMALVIILSIREGMRARIEGIYSTHGARVVFVHPGFDQVARKVGKLTPDDITRLESTPGILSAQPRAKMEMQVRTQADTLRAQVAGIDEQFISIFRVPMLRGRNFLHEEVVKKLPVCLITEESAKKLFPYNEGVGAQIDIQGFAFQVIGILDWGTDVNQRTGMPDMDLLLPAPWVNRQAQSSFSQLEVRVPKDLSSAAAIKLVKDVISRGNEERAKLYFVRSMEQTLERSKQFTDTILAGLLGIAAISLLVGGIGVANVMITSVTERTREVGIRKALGARRRDIIFQFLVEACVLSASGGILAVLTGAAGINLAPSYFKIPIPLIVPIVPIMACVGLTVLIGLLAGVYPASRAALMSPSEALRYE